MSNEIRGEVAVALFGRLLLMRSPEALENLRPGGRLVINAIRKEAGDQELMAGISYELHLWLEKEVKSVANVTSANLQEFLPLAGEIPLRPEVEVYPLEAANEALLELQSCHNVVDAISANNEPFFMLCIYCPLEFGF